ncbi:hypothetical protein B0E55_03789 [Rhodococcus sp. 66b]|nr:hypothetical protein B0E55_03789 [Rhodococcus sp. 66b]
MKWITGLFSGASRWKRRRGLRECSRKPLRRFTTGGYYIVTGRYYIVADRYYIAASGSLPDQSWPQ